MVFLLVWFNKKTVQANQWDDDPKWLSMDWFVGHIRESKRLNTLQILGTIPILLWTTHVFFGINHVSFFLFSQHVFPSTSFGYQGSTWHPWHPWHPNLPAPRFAYLGKVHPDASPFATRRQWRNPREANYLEYQWTICVYTIIFNHL